MIAVDAKIRLHATFDECKLDEDQLSELISVHLIAAFKAVGARTVEVEVKRIDCLGPPSVEQLASTVYNLDPKDHQRVMEALEKARNKT